MLARESLVDPQLTISDAGIDAGKLTPDGKNAEEMKKNLFDEDT